MSNPQSKRDELLHQAEILFADKGFYGTSINNVASELGMTKQGLLHYFPTKTKLYSAVLESAADCLMEHIDEALGQNNCPKQQLYGLTELYRSQDQRLLRVVRLFVRELLDNVHRAASAHRWFLTKHLNKMEAVVIAGQQQKIFRDVDAQAFLYQIVGSQQYFLISLPTLKQIYQLDDYDQFIDSHIDTLKRILNDTLFID